MNTTFGKRMSKLERAHADRAGRNVVFELLGIRVDEIGPEGRDELRTEIEAELKRRGEAWQ